MTSVEISYRTRITFLSGSSVFKITTLLHYLKKHCVVSTLFFGATVAHLLSLLVVPQGSKPL